MRYKYKVEHLQDSIYQVILISIILYKAYGKEEDKTIEEPVFQGNLSDCYAYIKLNEEQYM